MDQLLNIKGSIILITFFCCFVNCKTCIGGFFRDSTSTTCQECTVCSWTQITVRPCSHDSNTVCGHVLDFSSFSFKPTENRDLTSFQYDDDDNGDSISEDNGGRGRGLSKHGNFSPQAGFARSNDGQLHEAIVEKDDGEYWKNLALALIGVVCVLIVVATVVVLIACCKLNRNAAVKRPDEEEDDDSGYVLIRSIRPPPVPVIPQLPATCSQLAPSMSALLPLEERNVREVFPRFKQRQELRRKGTYRPKRRLLNYDADDVFESEDSAGSRNSRLGHLLPIPERSVSADSSSEQDCDSAPSASNPLPPTLLSSPMSESSSSSTLASQQCSSADFTVLGSSCASATMTASSGGTSSCVAAFSNLSASVTAECQNESVGMFVVTKT